MTDWRRLRDRWQLRWLDRRIPPARQITLGPRSLFILPTRMGLLYLLVLLAIYLLGTNYQNNLVLLVAYCLGSLFMTAMWLTHRNLLGLALMGGPTVTGEAGSQLPIRIRVQSPRPIYGVQFTLGDGALWQAEIGSTPLDLQLPVTGRRRGRLPLGRLKVESRYPLGLFRCWSLPDLQLEGWVYPKAVYGPLQEGESGTADEQQGDMLPAAIGDFDTLRAHQQGEAMSRIAWKQLAQGRGLLSKQFCEPHRAGRYLSLSRVTSGNLEQRLAVLAWWCCDYGKQGLPFSLTLAREMLGPDSGPAFVQRCLLALAQLDNPADEGRTDAAR
ncbi:DUF58 domain-containing protein [Aeromonas jandaei]|uniref:DUF58 domain-containing protein n=1 Tax=Aeromonas jandaei TaxID=650 RepID=UPI0012EC1912|nr:DUF58 domain-containing protein [Aeromonas jandaei]MVG13546.1 DUF58 domain-containing protein [Aeromonas jandaei]